MPLRRPIMKKDVGAVGPNGVARLPHVAGFASQAGSEYASAMFDTMNAATCATLAQVMPVFLIAFIAQDFVRNRSALPIAEHLISTFRSGLDAVLVILLLSLEVAFVIGVQSDGIQTKPMAVALWLGALYVAVFIVARWLLLSLSGRRLVLRSAKGSMWILSRLGPSREFRERARTVHYRWDNLSKQLAIETDEGELRRVDKRGQPIKPK